MIVRWSMRILAVMFLTVVVSTGISYWLVTRTSLLEEQVNSWLDSFISAQWPVAVSIGDISGEPWHLLRLTDVRVDEIQGDSLRPLIHVDTLELQYVWRKLVGRQWHINKMSVTGLTAHYGPYPSGRPPWLAVRDSAGAAKPLRIPQVEIEHVEFNDLSLQVRTKDSVDVHLQHAELALQVHSDKITLQLVANALKVEGMMKASVDTLAAKMIGFGREWFADDVVVAMDSTHISGTAHLNVDSSFVADATLKLDPVKWNDLAQLVHADLPGSGHVSAQLEFTPGRCRGRGTVEGVLLGRQLDGLGVAFQFQNGVVQFDTLFGQALAAHVEGRGRLDLHTRPIRYGVDAEWQGFNLQKLVPAGMPSNLTGRFEVAGVGANRRDLRVDVVADHAQGSLGRLEFEDAAGALTATADSLYLHPGFHARYMDADLSPSGAMAFADRMAISGDVHANDVNTMVAFLGYPGFHAGATGRFVISDTTAHPTLTFDLMLDSMRYKAIAAPQGRVWARLARAFETPVGRVSALLAPFSVGPLDLDSGRVSVLCTQNELNFDSIAAYRGADTLRATASLDRQGRNLTVQTFYATVLGRPVGIPHPAELYVGYDTLFVHHASLAQDSGSFLANGWVEYGGQLNLTMVAADARLGPWLKLFYPGERIDGKLFAELELTGTVDRPLLGYRLRLQHTEYDRFSLGDITAGGQLTSEHLLMDSVLMQTGDALYTASGELPFASGGKGLTFDKHKPLKGELEVEGAGIRVAGLVLPEVESFYGDVSGHLTVAGTLADPEFAGHISLWDGDLKTWSLREHFSPVQMEVELKDSVATIKEFRLHVKGDPHNIDVGGRLIFHGLTDLEYDLTTKGTDIPLSYEYADFTGRFDFDLTTKGQAPPLVAGKLSVREAYYRDPLEATDSLAKVADVVEPDTTSWNVNLDVNIDKNAWVKNDDIDAEWAGNVRVLRQDGQWNYLGTLEPLRGSYYLFGRRFRNLRGSITFDNILEVDPILNLEAEVNLPIAADTTGTGGAGSSVLTYQEVTVRLEGRLSEPQIIAPSWLGESNLLRALSPQSDLNSPAAALGGVAGYLTPGVEKAVTKTLGVETFEVRPSEAGWAETRLLIGTYLLPDVYVYGGTSPVDPTGGAEVGFEYRLKSWLRLQGNRSYNNLYEFNLRLKWEADK